MANGGEGRQRQEEKVVERVERVVDNIYLVTFNANVETGSEAGRYLEHLSTGSKHQKIGWTEQTFPEVVTNEIIRRCAKTTSIDLSTTTLYMILNDMGHVEPVAHSIMEDRTTLFTPKGQAALANKGYRGLESCQFLYAIVGSGIKEPTDLSSMPRGYLPMTPLSSPKRLLLEKTSEIISNTSFELTAKKSNFVLKAINNQPRLRLLLTNCRCAYVTASAIIKL